MKKKIIEVYKNVNKCFVFNEKEQYRITFRISNRCNFNCDYCSYRNNNDEYSTKAEIDNIIKYIIKIHEKTNKTIILYIHGGEPSIHPYFFYLCETLLDKIPIQIKFDTNLSGLIGENRNKTIRLLKKYGKNFRFWWSIHEKTLDNFDYFMNEYYKLSKFIEIKDAEILVNEHNIEYIISDILPKFDILGERTCKCLCPIGPRTNYFNNTYSDLVNEINHIDGQASNSIYYITYDNGEKQELTTEEFVNSTNFNFRLMKCDCGKTHQLIDWNGNIYSCQTHLLKNTKNPYFNIHKDKKYDIDKFVNNEITCIFNKCLIEWYIRKWKK